MFELILVRHEYVHTLSERIFAAGVGCVILQLVNVLCCSLELFGCELLECDSSTGCVNLNFKIEW